jgi:hypothetical protein
MTVRVHLPVEITKMFMLTCGRMQNKQICDRDNLYHTDVILAAVLAIKAEITSLGEIFNARYT